MPKGKRGKPPEDPTNGATETCKHGIDVDVSCNECRIEALDEESYNVCPIHPARLLKFIEGRGEWCDSCGRLVPASESWKRGQWHVKYGKAEPIPSLGPSTPLDPVNPVQAAANLEAATEPTHGDAPPKIHDPNIERLVMGMRWMAVDEMAKALNEIGRLSMVVADRKREWERLKERTATAKKAHDEAEEEAFAYIASITDRGADLPLFDQTQREQDQQRMEAAAASPAGELALCGSTTTSDEGEDGAVRCSLAQGHEGLHVSEDGVVSWVDVDQAQPVADAVVEEPVEA